VPVEEHLVFDNAVYPASSTSRFYKTATQLNTQSRNPSQSKPEPARLITQSHSKELSSTLINAVVALSNETARAGYGALVFCSSRAGCEKDAIMISQVLPRAREIDSCTAEKRRDLLNDLRSTTTGLDPILEKIIPIGVAFHREYGLISRTQF
jgi:replicative superfamily II helicase